MTALKLDENLSDELLATARGRGFDAESVRSEKLTGASDDVLFSQCGSERRALVTLDLDFSDPIRFPPTGRHGTIVLRPGRPSMQQISALFDAAMRALESESPEHAIWIVEPGRLRIYRSSDEDVN